ATVGAFRAVPLDDLRDPRERSADVWRDELSRLRSARLLRSVAPLDRDEHRTAVVTLTDRGRDLLERHRSPDRDPRQQFYCGVGGRVSGRRGSSYEPGLAEEFLQ